MILNDEYLSDGALEQLISEVEDGDLVPAPPELKANILHAIFGDLHTENTSEKEETAEATREMLKRVFGENGILKESDYFNIFMKKDGGQ